MKEEFINKELWVLTIGAGFQRSNVYPKRFKESDKESFKSALHSIITNITKEYKKMEVSDEEHIKNIHSILPSIPKEYKTNLNFGIAQKLLNLHLKYQWCLGNLHSDPPHFPVDRIIQIELNKLAKELKIKTIEIKPWTKFTNEKRYLKVVRLAEQVRDASDEYKDKSLAEMELDLFNKK